MEAVLPLIVSAAVALVLAPAALRDFTRNGWVRANWRGLDLPFPAGVLCVAFALTALVVLFVIGLVADLEVGSADALALGMGIAFLGLLDDVLDAPARGLRGHARALLGGGFSTGVLKAVGTLALALAVLPGRSEGFVELGLSVGVLVLATNAFNLLDLRPGRAAKAFLLLGIALLAITRDAEPLRELGVLIGPLMVLGFHDLRERAMLGDTGSNLLGALAGFWMVTALDVEGELAALAALVALTAYGELRSISRAIERLGPLRALDRLGRRREPAVGHARGEDSGPRDTAGS
ncbi:MAG: Undecaprenyl-phosphate N-acetylglucosaminyl 1-phosphate transferase [uncultured Solirubrobacteraceae bacterium]|uniref:Undecaprenyl-phosphate N-acetylglucosaminyl 1-phosphate transferase n=1 Tax=uncultured Solirubrobacteraceae bacterium TaxID=1162706 RepID=A0A6J4SYD6_9ACTN|nr:MAG: Undecaprenyl-phosphate N-acetylglucosaminyl 1-phosphate transferase [uncultured Solirubrobacteraceae bacterium]